MLPVPAAGHQTVAVLSGAASVTASSYGSWLTASPQYDPVNAFDGDPRHRLGRGQPEHARSASGSRSPSDHPLNLPASIGIQLLDDSLSRSVANQLQVSTAAGKVTTATAAAGRHAADRRAAGPTKWLRITITGASNVIPGNPGAGIRQVQIPGVRVTAT